MSKFFINKSIKQPNPMAAMYHREYLNEIRKSLGSRCTFLQHVRKVKYNKEDEHFLEARFTVVGGIKKVTFKIEGEPGDISNKNYQDLKSQLINFLKDEKTV